MCAMTRTGSGGWSGWSGWWGVTRCKCSAMPFSTTTIILGGESFVAKIGGLVESRPDDGAVPELRALRSAPSLEGLVSATARSYHAEAGEVLRPGRGQTEARDVAVCLARELTGARLREMGAAFAGLSQPSASLAASRIARRLTGDRSLSRRVADIREAIATQKPKS